MSGGGTPKDNSVELEQMKEQAAKEAQQAADQKAAAELKTWNTNVTNAGTAARSAAMNYFTSKGVDPAPYLTAINDMITQKSKSLSQLAPIGNTFGDLGQSVYQNAESAERLRANKALTTGDNAPFPTGYDFARLPNTYDDPTLDVINNEQLNEAQSFIDAMKARGVITDSGVTAAQQALGRQTPGAMARLTEQGNLALEGGRQQLRDVGGRAASAADALPVGSTFNTKVWTDQLENTFNDFITGLNSNIRGKIGNASLYDTSGLASVAGAAQGAGPGVQPSTAGLPFSTEDEDKKLANRTGSSTGLGV